MNGKPNEHLDQRIRQSLAGLPDGPPPGSSFDPDRLWEQLRPELTSTPAVATTSDKPAQRRASWWWVAASVVGLWLGVGWWYWPERASQRPSEPNQLVRVAPRKVPPVIPDIPSWPVSDKASSVVRQQATLPEPAHQPATVTKVAAPAAAPQPDALSVDPAADASAPIAAAPTNETVATATVPKRRFRVVHENELPAEDEAYQIRHRSGQFVRLGSGEQGQAIHNESLPSLRLPLSRKLTQ